MATRKKKRVRKLSDYVASEHGFALMGKQSAMGPAPYDAIPDYGDIYYQPDGDERKEDEAAARLNRREAMGVTNRGKYGFHGTADPSDNPILRYESDDFPQNSPRRQPSPNERRAAITEPNRYPQPSVKTGPIKHVVQREKMFGKRDNGTGGIHFNEANKPPVPKKPKPIPVVPRERFSARPPTASRPQVGTRAGR